LSVVESNTNSFIAYPNPYENQVVFENSSSMNLTILISTSQGVLIDELTLLPKSKYLWSDRHGSGLRVINFHNSEQRGQLKLLNF
ncbi:MAG: hypothetical protein P8H21_07740, partial [Woeseiaceae bacterium]|nr:hypothetical protein [Woeseiaceae bacterium]